MAKKALIHKHTNQTTTNGNILSPKLPTSGTLLKGEIAVNYKNGYETLSIENDAGEVIPFASLEQTMAYTDASIVNADWNATSGKAQILNKPDIPDEKLSSSYQTSTLENENLSLAGGDTYETAFSKIEKAILDNEETIAASLNDLNTRKIEIDDVPTKTSQLTNDSGYITSFTESDPTVPLHVKSITQQDISNWNNKLSSAPVTSVNGKTGAVTIEIPENQLSNSYSSSTLINEDLFLEAGDTYEEAFSKLEKSINDNEQITSAALSDLDSRIPTKTSDLDNDSLPSLDNILFPNFNNLTPINTIEFDVSATTYYKLFLRINTGVSNLKDVNEIIKFRITVTGTNIYSESDIIVIMPLALVYPTILGYNRVLNNAAATTGLMYIRCCYPKALNSNYPWMTELRVYNATARHIKIEVFESPENITWVTSKTSTTYNSTYLAAQEVLFYTRRGFISSGVSWMAGDVQGTATSAAYINSYLDIWVGGTLPLTGEALTTNSLIYMSGDKLYKATNKTMPIEPFVGIIKTGTSYNAGVTPSYAYLQLKISWTALTGDSALVIPTLTRGDQVYLRCTMNNGNIYSDGTLSTTMDAGYTWVHIGTAQSATAINLDTCGKFFITLASDGKVTHINGKAIQGGSGGGGDENVIETVKVNGTALTPDANKAVNITVPTPYIMEFSESEGAITIEEHAFETLSNAISEERDVYLKNGSYLYALNEYGEDYLYFTHANAEEFFIESVAIYNDNNFDHFFRSLCDNHINVDTALGAGDKIVITDASNNNNISRSTITFDGSTTTKALTPKGTWETFLQSYTETDPTVPAWAKAASKPTYTAAEVGALPDTYTPPVISVNGQTGAVTVKENVQADWNATSGDAVILNKPNIRSNGGMVSQIMFGLETTINGNDSNGLTLLSVDEDINLNAGGKAYYNNNEIATKNDIPTNVSAFTNDAGYLTSYTETDPTVPAWAKAANKPSYTAAEVGALPDTYTAPVTSVNGQTGAVTLALGQTNIIETVKVNNTTLTPDSNKVVNITVPTISYTEDASNSVGQLSLNNTTYTLISGTSPMGSSEAYTAPSWGAFNNIKPWAFEDVRVSGEQWSDTELSGGSHYLKFEAPFYLSSGSSGPGITLATNDLNTSSRTVINQIISNYDTTGNDAWSHAGDTALATVGLIKTKIDAKYTKSSTGIPKTDLASAVQTSLGKADSAIQSHQSIKSINTNNTTAQTVNLSEAVAGSGTINLHKVAKTGTYSDLIGTPTIPAAVTESTVSGWGFTKNTGTITGITMNGSSKGTSGVVNLGTVLTSHQTLKTINNESIVGSGNLTVSGLPTVSASDNGKILQVVNGAWALVTPVTVYTGTSTPNNSLGNNGDIYLQTS